MVLCIAAISVEYERRDTVFVEWLSSLSQGTIDDKVQNGLPQSYAKVREAGGIDVLEKQLVQAKLLDTQGLEYFKASTKALKELWEALAVSSIPDVLLVPLLQDKTYEDLSKLRKEKKLLTADGMEVFSEIYRTTELSDYFTLSEIFNESFFIETVNFKRSTLDKAEGVTVARAVRLHSVEV